MQVFFMAAGKWLRDRDVVEHNFQLEGKQGERKAHYYITRAHSAREGKEERETGTQDYVTTRNLYSICPHALTMFIEVPVYRDFSDERYGGRRVGATICPHS